MAQVTPVERTQPVVRARGARWDPLGIVTLVGMVILLYAALVYAPTESVQGPAQRIFYIHVPMAMMTLIGYGLVFLGSIMYLWKRSAAWDRLAHAAAEVGVVFTTLAIITGSIWGKPIWGTWWTWDARLTSTFVLWLIYIAYLMLRASATGGTRVPRYAAILGIFGGIDLPIVQFSVTWWRTLHPGPVILQPSGPALPPAMLIAFIIGFVEIALLYVYLLRQRLALAELRETVDSLKAEVAE